MGFGTPGTPALVFHRIPKALAALDPALLKKSQADDTTRGGFEPHTLCEHRAKPKDHPDHSPNMAHLTTTWHIAYPKTSLPLIRPAAEFPKEQGLLIYL